MCSRSAPRCTAQWKVLRRLAATRTPSHCSIVWRPGSSASAALRCADAHHHGDALGRSGSPSVHAGRRPQSGAAGRRLEREDQAVALSASEEGLQLGDRSGTHKRSELGEDWPNDRLRARFPRGISARRPAQRSTEPRRNRGVAAAVAVIALIGVGILIVRCRTVRPQAIPRPFQTSRPPPPQSTKLSTAPQVRHSEQRSARIFHGAARSPPTATPRTKLVRPPRSIANDRTDGPGAPTAAQLRRAITSYYALMPRNTDAAWPRMTASYPNQPCRRAAGLPAVLGCGRPDLCGGCGGYRQVRLRQPSPTTSKTAESCGRTAYGLINDGGRLKINSTTVLSSVTL